jgi:tripartite-type tricarboxylate transporter receptor subunit TctC
MPNVKMILLSIMAGCLGLSARAEEYPSRPIHLIVSIAAGSVTDVVLRSASNNIAPRIGQPLVIENRGGASGILGGQACATAAPDGYTLCAIYQSTVSYNPVLFASLPYDADKDFEPITRLFFVTEGVFVPSSLGVNSIAELKTLAQSKPDALNFATLGDGSSQDLFLRWVNHQLGTVIVGVPYKGGAPAAQAIAANEVQVTRFGIGNFLGLIESGRVKVLGISSDKRSSLLPDVPTLTEAGWGEYPGQAWWGLVAPKGTPPAIIAKMSAEFVRTFSDPKFLEFLDKQFVVPAPTSPAEFGEFLKADRKAAEALVRIANMPKAQYKPE